MIKKKDKSLAVRNAIIQSDNQLENQKKEIESVDFSGFFAVSKILNKSTEKVIDECILFQLKKIMNRLGKVVVRYNVSDSEVEKIFINSVTLDAGEIAVSPVYIPVCAKKSKKLNLSCQKVNALVDFPFGESSFKNKLIEVKNCVSQGVDGIDVILPTMLLEKENVKELKKEIKKLGKFSSDIGVGFSVMDMDGEKIKSVVKSVEKSKLSNVLFIFGEVTEKEFSEKINIINAVKGKKEIKIMCNVNSIEGIMKLFSYNVDKILTPFADDIGKSLVSAFKIKSIKLK